MQLVVHVTCNVIIFQTRSVTEGKFSSNLQLEPPLRCKLQEKIAPSNRGVGPVYMIPVYWDVPVARDVFYPGLI